MVLWKAYYSIINLITETTSSLRTRVSLLYEKDRLNIDNFRGFIEKLSLFEPKWSLTWTFAFLLFSDTPPNHVFEMTDDIAKELNLVGGGGV